MIDRALAFATRAHAGQVRRYTGEPYIEHPKAVMRLVADVPHTKEQLAAALLHDVVEDTETPLVVILSEFGPSVALLVLDLTDQIPPSFGNRAARKDAERARIAGISSAAKTVKLADLIDNTTSIVQHDPSFARTYLPEKREILTALTKADRTLWRAAWACLLAAEATLEAIKHPAAG